MTVEVYGEDLLAGHTTYRFYMNMANEDDFLSSIYGNDLDAFSLTTSTGFYNSEFGSTVASGINPAFFSFFPDLAADSWVTIGIDSQNVGDEVAISTVESSTQPWINAFAAGEAISGQNIVMDDFTGGAWFVLNGTPNGLPDADGRVLFMQVTTAGDISGTVNAQIFVNGDGGNDVRNSFDFDGVGTYGIGAYNACGCTDEEAFNYDPEAVYDDGSCEAVAEGCTDAAACNYDSSANTDDGSCEYADAGYDCNGICLTDTDGDGVCDEFEIEGCTIEMACNYNPDATEDDGSCEVLSCSGCLDEAACNYDPTATIDNPEWCEYADAGYDCDGNCLADADGDGVCDEFEVAGCTDASACNYDADATTTKTRAPTLRTATTATVTAWRTPTATAYATSLKSQDVRILKLATTTVPRQKMTIHVSLRHAQAVKTKLPATTIRRRQSTMAPARTLTPATTATAFA